MKSDRESIWARIMQDPDDDVARGIFADHLDDFEPQDPVRASFIRKQLALAVAGMSHEESKDCDCDCCTGLRECRDMAQPNLQAWSGECWGPAAMIHLYRGLVEHVEVNAQEFLKVAPAMFADQPIRIVTPLGIAPAFCPLRNGERDGSWLIQTVETPNVYYQAPAEIGPLLEQYTLVHRRERNQGRTNYFYSSQAYAMPALWHAYAQWGRQLVGLPLYTPLANDTDKVTRRITPEQAAELPEDRAVFVMWTPAGGLLTGKLGKKGGQTLIGGQNVKEAHGLWVE